MNRYESRDEPGRVPSPTWARFVSSPLSPSVTHERGSCLQRTISPSPIYTTVTVYSKDTGILNSVFNCTDRRMYGEEPDFMMPCNNKCILPVPSVGTLLYYNLPITCSKKNWIIQI